MNGNLATIVKDGKLIHIDEEHLCVDDLVVLQAGDLVPADLKLVEARSLEIDEFELTGEIMPVIKDMRDDDGFVYMGSRVLKGSGKGIVVSSGEQTEYGRVLKQEGEQTNPYKFGFVKRKYLGLVGLLLPGFIMQISLSNQDLGVLAFYLLLSVFLILLQNDELFKYLVISNEHNKLGLWESL
jgi:Ca2+-transporting ATPase